VVVRLAPNEIGKSRNAPHCKFDDERINIPGFFANCKDICCYLAARCAFLRRCQLCREQDEPFLIRLLPIKKPKKRRFCENECTLSEQVELSGRDWQTFKPGEPEGGATAGATTGSCFFRVAFHLFLIALSVRPGIASAIFVHLFPHR
jgi:hypothetical protein